MKCPQRASRPQVSSRRSSSASPSLASSGTVKDSPATLPASRVARSSAVSVQKTKEAVNRAYDVMGWRQALAAGLDIDVEINATPSFEKTEFARIRKEQGVKAAIAWRDARFAED